MLVLLAAHALAALLAPTLVRWRGRDAFTVLALVPAAAFGWILTRLPDVLAGRPPTEVVRWIPALGVDLAFRLDPLSATVSLLVTGVGALVLLYCSRYFAPSSGGLPRFAGVLVAFAGAMLALVWADDVVVLYVSWELTTIFSFLLVGHDRHKRAGRAAAVQALTVTAAGGLTMLVGLVILAEAAGTYRLSALVTTLSTVPPSGAAVSAGVVCVLVGAVSKSALVPFHFWLPSAMAAPTPVSAFLHAAAMVKAGVYLVLRLAPALADVGPWRPLVAVLAAATMLLGGIQALRQHDLKLLLAHGTVSQLGFMILVAGAGTRDAALAALALVVGHALFKACLFLSVGVVDRAAGTRDLRELSGVGRRAPALAVAATLGAASMAGIPPLLGFVSKEGAFEAFLRGAYGGGAPWGLLVVVVGSVLTVAYSLRFTWGAFAAKPGVETTSWTPPGPLFVTAPAVLAGASLVAGPAVAAVNPLLTAYADVLPASAPTPLALKVWPGPTVALGLSVLAIVLGALVGLPRVTARVVARRPLAAIRSEVSWRAVLHALESTALAVTGRTQRGSLPVVLTTVFVVLVLGPGLALLLGARGGVPLVDRVADSPMQVLAAVVSAACTLAAVRARRRLAAVLLVGGTGYAVALLFAVAGAPDVALTQFLVETMTLVVAVLVLRRLPRDISERHGPRPRWSSAARLLIAVPVGVLLAVLGAAALSVRDATPVSAAFPALAYAFGQGANVVNVTLVDIRAWDTIGELSVLVAAATGVASLVFLDGRTGGPPHAREWLGRRVATRRSPSPVPAGGSGGWLWGVSRAMRPEDPGSTPAGDRSWRRPISDRTADDDPMAGAGRAVLLEVVTRLVFPTVMVLSVYFLFAGHNVPGGGFAGGLVAGLALVVRYVAGGRYELGEAAPVDAGLLLGAGLVVAGVTGAASLLFGGEVLQTAVLQADLPVLGNVKLVTSVFFDVGVYLVVIGLVLDILRSLGAELDRRGAPAPPFVPPPARQEARR